MLEKIEIVDRIEVVENGTLQVRTKTAIKEDGIDWLHVLNDADINDLAKSHDINGYPTKFLIDRNGKFILKILGTSEALHKTLESKLAELMPD